MTDRIYNAQKLVDLAQRMALNASTLDDTSVDIEDDSDDEHAMSDYWETVAHEVLPENHPILEKDELTEEDIAEINNVVRTDTHSEESDPDTPAVPYTGTDPLEYDSDAMDESEGEYDDDMVREYLTNMLYDAGIIGGDLPNEDMAAELEQIEEEDEIIPALNEGRFALLAKETLQDFSHDMNFDAEAVAALLAASETYIEEWMNDAKSRTRFQHEIH